MGDKGAPYSYLTHTKCPCSLCLVVILKCSIIATVDSRLRLTIIFLVLVEGKAYSPSRIDIYIQRMTGKHKKRAVALVWRQT